MFAIVLRFWLMLSLVLSGTSGHIQSSYAGEDGSRIVVICTPSGFEKVTIDKNGNIVKEVPTDSSSNSLQNKCPLCTAYSFGLLLYDHSGLDFVSYAETRSYCLNSYRPDQLHLYSVHPPRAPPFSFHL